jgi:hypothetical protein
MSNEAFTISVCPTCDSPRIKRVCSGWEGTYGGKHYSVPALEHYSCPDCGEKVYPPQAMRKIEQASPAYLLPKARRQARMAALGAARRAKS